MQCLCSHFLYQIQQTKPFSKYQSKENDLPIKQERWKNDINKSRLKQAGMLLQINL